MGRTTRYGLRKKIELRTHDLAERAWTVIGFNHQLHGGRHIVGLGGKPFIFFKPFLVLDDRTRGTKRGTSEAEGHKSAGQIIEAAGKLGQQGEARATCLEL